MPTPATPLLARVFPFVPVLRGYDAARARRDAVAALTVALFTIPQGMAYATIAGFPPQLGITTAVVASILGAAFGSSEFLMNGPTNAISVMLAANAALFATTGNPIEMVVSLTFLIGAVQVVAGWLRLGSAARFVSEPVLTGFTAGAGVYIVINQLPTFFGIPSSQLAKDIFGWVPPKAALADLVRCFLSMVHLSLPTLALSIATVAIVRLVQAIEPRVHRRLPGPLFAVAAVTAAAWALGLGDPARGAEKVRLVRDIEPLTRALPKVAWPTLSVAHLRPLLGPAFAIGILGAVEAIAIGKVLAARAGHRFDASRQLVGEGLCNVGAALVGGFASSGSFSRSAVNYEAGAATRLSCILSGVLVLVITLIAAPLANLIPIAALAGTLVHIGWKLVDVSRIRALVATTLGDRVTFLATFSAVLLVEHLEYALFFGVIVAIVQALRRAERYRLTPLREGADGALIEIPEARPADLGDVATLNLQGELFFAAAEVLERQLTAMLDDNTRFLVIRMQEAYNLDATTAEALATVARLARARGGRLVLCGVRPGMYGTLARAGVLAVIGEEAVFVHQGELLGSTRKAMAFAYGLAERSGARSG